MPNYYCNAKGPTDYDLRSCSISSPKTSKLSGLESSVEIGYFATKSIITGRCDQLFLGTDRC